MRAAKLFVECLSKKELTFPNELLSPQMQKHSIDSLLKVASAQVGEFKSVEQWDKHTAFEKGEFTIYRLPAQFQVSKFDLLIVTKNEIIHGFNVVAHETFAREEGSKEECPENVEEKKTFVGEDPFRLKAKICFPKNLKRKTSGLVLVHGSGPNNMDETILACKPFKDIAHSLSSEGFVVLRYNKRTFEHSKRVDPYRITPEEEVIEDVVSAVKRLLEEELVDKVFVLGHSLGGYLIPRIASRCQEASGFISMNGCTRPIYELVIDQTKYLSPLDEERNEEVRIASEKIRKLEIEEKEHLFGAGKSYWEYLSKFDPVKECRMLCQFKPFLFLQGEADYQVLYEKDFLGGWKKLSDYPKASFKSYKQLNHLMNIPPGVERQQGQLSSPIEYSIPTKVDKQVISDIKEWLSQNS